MRRKLLWACLFGTVVVITGCGGGGGGGGSPYNSPSPILRPVPYSTPVRVGSVTPINSTAREYDSSAMFAENLSGTGEELITAGRSGTSNQGSYPTSNLNVFGWSNGSLVNQTTQWFNDKQCYIAPTSSLIYWTLSSKKSSYFSNSCSLVEYIVYPHHSTWQYLHQTHTNYSNCRLFPPILQ